ncbi:MAG: hypothetical protein AVDCRST_MAG04-3320, partial [uncultured Acetobacteraceae bacterium]
DQPRLRTHRERREVQPRRALHEGNAGLPPVRLLRPGGAGPVPPRRALQRRERPGGHGNPGRHQGLRQLADHPAALRQRRVRGRLRHRHGDVPGRRAADHAQGEGHPRLGRGL